MKTRLPSFGACATVLIAALGATAHAAPSEYFGQRGQLVLGGESRVSAVEWQHERGENNAPNINNLGFQLGPRLGVFVSRNVLIGLDLSFDVSLPGKDPKQAVETGTDLVEQTGNRFALGAMPRIGYNIDFGAGVSLLPSIGVGYHFERRGKSNGHQVEAELRLPFVFQIARHGALVAGPTGSYSSDGSNVTKFLPAKFKVGVAGGLLIWI